MPKEWWSEWNDIKRIALFTNTRKGAGLSWPGVENFEGFPRFKVEHPLLVFISLSSEDLLVKATLCIPSYCGADL